jgi:hypothetical protein
MMCFDSREPNVALIVPTYKKKQHKDHKSYGTTATLYLDMTHVATIIGLL